MKSDKLKDVILNFCNKEGLDLDILFFLYNDQKIHIAKHQEIRH